MPELEIKEPELEIKEPELEIKEPSKALPAPKTVRIVLEEQGDDKIPPGIGQFISHNDRFWHLKPGKEVEVPVELLSVLDDAIERVPVHDPDSKRISGWRVKKRFPYTIVRD